MVMGRMDGEEKYLRNLPPHFVPSERMIWCDATGKMDPARDRKNVLHALALDAYIVYVWEELQRGNVLSVPVLFSLK